MSISLNTALGAYNNAMSISKGNDSQDTGNIFSNLIGNGVSDTISTLKQAENVSAKALVKQADITDVVTAITDAEVTLKTVVSIRDKLIAAHQEILRMPI